MASILYRAIEKQTNKPGLFKPTLSNKENLTESYTMENNDSVGEMDVSISPTLAQLLLWVSISWCRCCYKAVSFFSNLLTKFN